MKRTIRDTVRRPRCTGVVYADVRCALPDGHHGLCSNTPSPATLIVGLSTVLEEKR